MDVGIQCIHDAVVTTGYGMALLTTLYGDRTQNPLLRASAPNVKNHEIMRTKLTA